MLRTGHRAHPHVLSVVRSFVKKKLGCVWRPVPSLVVGVPAYSLRQRGFGYEFLFLIYLFIFEGGVSMRHAVVHLSLSCQVPESKWWLIWWRFAESRFFCFVLAINVRFD